MLDYISPFDWENQDVDETIVEASLPKIDPRSPELRDEENVFSVLSQEKRPLTISEITTKGSFYFESDALEALKRSEEKRKVKQVEDGRWSIMSEASKSSLRKKESKKKRYKNQRGQLIFDGIKKQKRKRDNSEWIEYYYCYRTLNQKKRSKYIPKSLVEDVKKLEQEKIPIVEILSFIDRRIPLSKL